MKTANKCPFCLKNSLLKGDILFEDDLIYFAAPKVPGVKYDGGLIVTKRHIKTPFEISKAEWLRIHELLPTFKKFVDTHNPDGYNLGWNVHEVGGQTVMHAHLHFFGRHKDEPQSGKGIRYAFRKSTDEAA